ncbi:TRAF-type zinc finger domain-containing protein 1 isoform X4 [Carettochelys insculpta]|uniref:TRAF-type zinc finger domain-containing protein 1 isoform X4 n=1 Tax=Carettochelys insculpta TaxID=44489 RepID=UPI003EBCFAC6
METPPGGAGGDPGRPSGPLPRPGTVPHGFQKNMDMAAVKEQETQLCSNCKKDIPVANFTIHEIHCSRNIGVCRFCKESLPKSEMKNHIESEHVQVTCKCNMKMEKCHLEDHEASVCPFRPAVCQHCEIELAFNKLQDHEDYCGSRTETCKDELDWQRNINMESSLYGEPNSNLDYMLALSLQRENNPRNNIASEIHSDFWKNFYSKESKPLEHLTETNKSDGIMLPCEFCEALYPEEDLILHETGCNPASICASLSKRSCSPTQQQEHISHAKDLLDQLHSRRSSYPLQQQAVLTEGSIIIPCEFCGVQLEEEILFHHQDQCDSRPATVSPVEGSPSWQSLPPKDNLERSISPEVRRRIRHQGEISARYLEDVGQQRLTRAVRGDRPWSNLATARSLPVTSLGAVNATAALTQKGKSINLDRKEEGLRSRGTAESGTGSVPHPVSYMPSFPRTSPGRPSVRNEAGRNPRVANIPVNFKNRSTKAKSQRPPAGHPEEE